MEHSLEAGDEFDVQFVWQLPDGDFIRAIFQAQILAIDLFLDRYLVRLMGLQAGRQETPTGEMRSAEAISRDQWALVNDLVGRRVHLAFEAADGRPLRLRFATLTGEHSFFSRWEDD